MLNKLQKKYQLVLSALLSVFFLPFSFFFFSKLWDKLVLGKMYYDSDPFALFNIIPPFVHSYTFKGTSVPDYWISPEWLVYLVWGVFLILIFIFPTLVAFFVSKKVIVEYKRQKLD